MSVSVLQRDWAEECVCVCGGGGSTIPHCGNSTLPHIKLDVNNHFQSRKSNSNLWRYKSTSYCSWVRRRIFSQVSSISQGLATSISCGSVTSWSWLKYSQNFWTDCCGIRCIWSLDDCIVMTLLILLTFHLEPSSTQISSTILWFIIK